MEKPGPLTLAAKGIALVAVLALVLVPFLIVISTSLASPEQVIENGGWVLWPTELSFGGYREILSGGLVTKAMLVSVGITVAGTAISLGCTVMFAYTLSRPGIYGGKPILLLVLFTFLFPPGMIPSYLVVKELGLLNSFASLILPVAISVFNLIVMRGFFQSIPKELYEAAHLDGASEWKILVRIVLPLSKAVVAVIGLFYAVTYWNSWFQAMLYLDDSAKWPLQLILRTYVVAGAQIADPSLGQVAMKSAPQTIQMAVVVLAVIPILIVYPFIQRHFVKGMLAGAIKS